MMVLLHFAILKCSFQTTLFSSFLTIITGNVTDRPRAGRPRKTTPREDWLISRRAWQRPFSTAGALRGYLAHAL